MGDTEFDVADGFDSAPPAREEREEDPMRPEARRGRYSLPNPENGKKRSYGRVSNFIKLADDTYHLELWKQRNILKGLALMSATREEEFIPQVGTLDVKVDKEKLNRIAETAMREADAYRMADEGTHLHKSAELVDFAGGDLNVAPERHQVKMALYLSALRDNGLTVVPNMIERVTASLRYDVAGKFDRVCRMSDGSNAIVDVKTGDSLDLSMPSIAAQLDCYRDGINNTGIFDGKRYDQSIKVRDDIGLVIHLPSTRNEVHVIEVDLAAGAEINEVNLAIRNVRRIKAGSCSRTFRPSNYQLSPDAQDQGWLEQMNAANSYAELFDVATRARRVGQWNARLSAQARLLAPTLPHGKEGKRT